MPLDDNLNEEKTKMTGQDISCQLTALASILVRMRDCGLRAAEAPAEPNTGAATVLRNFPSGNAYVPPK